MERIYSINEIASLVAPVASAYGVERIMLFGSYARGEARLNSDIDLRIDEGAIKGYFRLAGFYREIEEKFSIPVDVLTTGALSNEFLERIKKDEVILYELLPKISPMQRQEQSPCPTI